MSRWTSVEHVRARYEGRIGPEQERVVATWIGDAEAMLSGRVPGLAARVASGALAVADVQRVVAGAVIRYLRNPSGITQRTVGEGSFNSSTSYAASSTGTGGLAFTEAELAELRPGGAVPAGFGVVYQRPSRRWAGPAWPQHEPDRAPGAER